MQLGRTYEYSVPLEVWIAPSDTMAVSPQEQDSWVSSSKHSLYLEYHIFSDTDPYLQTLGGKKKVAEVAYIFMEIL